MAHAETENSAESDTGYVIRPNFQHKFRSHIVKHCINEVLVDLLGDQDYNAKKCSELVKSVTEAIKEKLKTLELSRYKFLVQVMIGEQRGEGVKMSCRCLWDSDTDNYAQDVFMNGTLFCVAAVFGVFYY